MDEKLTSARRIAQRLLHMYEVYGAAGIDPEDAAALARLVSDLSMPRPIITIDEGDAPEPLDESFT